MNGDSFHFRFKKALTFLHNVHGFPRPPHILVILCCLPFQKESEFWAKFVALPSPVFYRHNCRTKFDSLLHMENYDESHGISLIILELVDSSI